MEGGPVARGAPIVGGWASRKLRKSDSNSPIADHSARIARLLHTVKSRSPRVRFAHYQAKWNPTRSEIGNRESWHPARHGGFDEATFVFLGDSAGKNLPIENEPTKPV
jgi:hypothetical protein